METIMISFAAGFLAAVVFAWAFVHVVKVTWQGKPVSDYMTRRNILMTMQDEVVKGGFIKVRSRGGRHTGRLILIKL